MATLNLEAVPFVDAIKAALALKVVLADEYYGDLIGVARGQAFTVSDLAKVTLIEQVRDSLTDALSEGKTFAQWRADAVANPGLTKLPSHRLETIFRNAVQSAYMAGRCKQFQRNQQNRPYLMYSAINDSRVRPAHLAMDRTVLPVGHPWWLTHMPPNGHRCRCTVTSLTTEEALTVGITETPPDDRADTGWGYSVCIDPTSGLEQTLRRQRSGLVDTVRALLPDEVPIIALSTLLASALASQFVSLLALHGENGATLGLEPHETVAIAAYFDNPDIVDGLLAYANSESETAANADLLPLVAALDQAINRLEASTGTFWLAIPDVPASMTQEGQEITLTSFGRTLSNEPEAGPVVRLVNTRVYAVDRIAPGQGLIPRGLRFAVRSAERHDGRWFIDLSPSN